MAVASCQLGVVRPEAELEGILEGCSSYGFDRSGARVGGARGRKEA